MKYNFITLLDYTSKKSVNGVHSHHKLNKGRKKKYLVLMYSKIKKEYNGTNFLHFFIMFGSLLQFLPQGQQLETYHTQDLIEKTKKQCKKMTSERRKTENGKRILLKSNHEKVGAEIKYHNKETEQLANETISSEKQFYEEKRVKEGVSCSSREYKTADRRPQNKEFVADDKTFLLNHFKKLKKCYDRPNSNDIDIRKIFNNSRKTEQQKPPKPSYLHLKGKLKQDHHLLKSLLQVEEQEQVNPQTFFQISFANLSQQIDKIKLDRQLREINSQQLQSSQKVKFLLYLNKKLTQRGNSLEQSTRPFGNQFHPKQSPRHTLMMQTRNRWLSSRSKSYQRSSQKQRENISSSLQVKRNAMKRKVVMNKIDRLLSGSPRLKKKSSSYRGCSLRVTLSKTSSKCYQ